MTILAILLLILLVLIVLLAIPVVMIYQVSWEGTFEGEIKLHWLFGLVHIAIPVTPSKAKQPGSKTPRQKKRKKKARKKKTSPFAAIRQKSFRDRVLRFIRDIWRAIDKRNLLLRIRIGLDDPADTGQLWALLGPLSGLLANIRQATIQIQPEFHESVFELDSSGRIRLIPLQMIGLTLALLLSPPFWRGVNRMRGA